MIKLPIKRQIDRQIKLGCNSSFDAFLFNYIASKKKIHLLWDISTSRESNHNLNKVMQKDLEEISDWLL